MRYTPKHLVAPGRNRRLASMTLASTATLVASLAVTAPTAQADSVWDRVAACESSGNWSINTGNSFYGGLQFYQPTWVGFGGQQYAPYAHQATKEQQIAIARKVLAVQGPGAWPVCSVKAGLTRANGGASSSATAPAAPKAAPAPAPKAAPAPAPKAAPAPAPKAAPAPRQEAASRQAPAAQVSGWRYTVQSGDTVSGLAQRHGSSIAAIVSANELANGGRWIFPGQTLVIPGVSAPKAATTTSYTVKSGDTVWRIAQANGVTVTDIAQASNLSNPDLILPGQQLQIPSS